jgi:hypothetical protein
MSAVRRLAAAALLALVAGGLSALAPPVGAAAPWWQLAGFAGDQVSRVALVAGRLVVVVDGTAMARSASGFRFSPTSPPPAAAPVVSVGAVTWSIDSAGLILVSRGGGAPVRDPGSPDLGAGAHLIAAPLAAPRGVAAGSVVVAVSASGVVWRRSPAGDWAISLLLLPGTLFTGTPAISSIAAFSASRQSEVVYLGTLGYGTLLSDDGGDDWTRAGPGLPADVLSLAADPSGAGAIWAGTAQGLYVHRLRPLPGIPAYSGGSLTARWLLTVAVSAGVALLAGAALVLWARRWGARRVPDSPAGNFAS